MRTLVTVVFTIERNLLNGKECVRHLQSHGFQPILQIYPAAPKDSSWRVNNKSIMQNHYNVVRWFLETHDSTYDLMICEDDCEFVEPNSSKMVESQLKMLHREYDWSVLYLGQIAYGPLFPTSIKRLVRTTIPVGAHGYVLNGRRLRHYFDKVRPSMWTVPFMTEACFCMPLCEKFAIYPSIATQNRPTKGMRRIPFLRDMSVLSVIRFLEQVMYGLPYVVVCVLLVVVLVRNI